MGNVLKATTPGIVARASVFYQAIRYKAIFAKSPSKESPFKESPPTTGQRR
jgi:hypothetical protein